MGILDAFTIGGNVDMKYREFYLLVKEAAKAEIIMNAVKCEVPYAYIREATTGQKEKHLEIPTKDLGMLDGYNKTFSVARSLFAELDIDEVENAADLLKRLIDAAEEERFNILILENDKKLREEKHAG